MVTSFGFRLHRVGPTVYGGMLIYQGDSFHTVVPEAIKLMEKSPDELFLLIVLSTAPPAPFLPREMHGNKMIVIVGGYMGDPKQGEQVVLPFKHLDKFKVDMMAPIPYLSLQSLPNEFNPPGIHNYWKNHYISNLTPEVLDNVYKYWYDSPSPLTEVHLKYLGDALKKAGSDGAFSHRDARFNLNIVSKWIDPSQTQSNVAWTKRFFESMEPYSSGHYINYLGELSNELLAASYENPKYRRLQEIRAKYDPQGLFTSLKQGFVARA
ncbi:hypothetical protein B9Q12_01015 [Candidatus Marsarchaeota G2 archaeon ECH_B_SAG-G06]|uniref:Berberine/berberine-like domain-containing protein n=1 Tax=Candidatus Marsarchaeota G2 archaeon ECH_B_SAG-G06 TaxID=1978166 RepID=A0A2R6C2S4_9ARCH|nr:MAG: hypothetical protein B9Q12_01015 [Candidatus Marsarchaeota G2 archaeon ECH_B_SAG-G06]